MIQLKVYLWLIVTLFFYYLFVFAKCRFFFLPSFFLIDNICRIKNNWHSVVMRNIDTPLWLPMIGKKKTQEVYLSAVEIPSSKKKKKRFSTTYCAYCCCRYRCFSVWRRTTAAAAAVTAAIAATAAAVTTDGSSRKAKRLKPIKYKFWWY